MDVFEYLFEYLGENRNVDLSEKRISTQKLGVLLFDTKIEGTLDHQQFEWKNKELIAKFTYYKYIHTVFGFMVTSAISSTIFNFDTFELSRFSLAGFQT